TFHGVIVTSGISGSRTVVNSVIIAKGVFSGTGRVVEVPNLPGDPDNVSRDEFVFAGGTMELVSTTLSFELSLNPRACRFSVTVQQTSHIVGGTGRFATATGTSSTATVTARGKLARTADGSCSPDRIPLHEVDHLASSGTLSL